MIVMENYSYPDSGNSSPRSREIDFENPPPWDDPPNYKPKFMCSYGGKIQPRSHDNQLSYVGGETKILAVDRNIKFSAMISKLSALCSASDVSFKYQLPGEDLDALISVSNDDDLEHLMHEYDRLYRASAKPARMRLFLFTSGSERDRFVTAPALVPPDPVKPPPASDFLFGLDKAQPVPVAVKFHDPVPEPAAAPAPEYQPRGGFNPTGRLIGSDPAIEIQRQLQHEMQRFQISDHDQSAYHRRKSEDNLGAAGDYYAQHKLQEKHPPSNFPAAAPHAASYWPERHLSGEGFPVTMSSASGGAEPPVYVIPTPGTFYQPQMVRPSTVPATQGYYTVQRMGSDAYREHQMYGAAVPTTIAPAQQPVKPSTYAEGYSVVRPDGTAGAYAQVSYDSTGTRQVFYTASGGVVHAPPYPPPVGQDVKVANKVSQGSV